ncbi:MAG: UvrD-helicase domain-containing protein, partial [Clostridia bacterium]|nr:UvrD-helicase domain-containing protein [Clostridia bacterium]
MKTTDEQRRAIGETERTVLLSAAAGSGKTSVLTERLCRMICRKENPLAVDRMLVVTFTNAAARTLYLRIEQSIDEALQKNPGNEALLRASLVFAAARSKTSDSLCA